MLGRPLGLLRQVLAFASTGLCKYWPVQVRAFASTGGSRFPAQRYRVAPAGSYVFACGKKTNVIGGSGRIRTVDPRLVEAML